MKRFALYIGMVAALVASCSIQEEDFKAPVQDDVIFYASFEQPSEETRVYANEDLLLRWNADDRVSIFNKLTYNQQYKFTGNTGANAGGFKKVGSDEFVTGDDISHFVSVYPYQESTEISESEVLTLTLPAEQHYAENTFGLGANTMAAVSEDNVLQYKNVGGYLRISLYGESVSVTSITLKGNNGEKLAGKASVTMPLDGVPTTMMADDATKEITLVCDTPVQLSASAEKSKDFWFVVPPISFSKGFTLIVRMNDEDPFPLSTAKSVSISRSTVSTMSPVEIEAEITQPKNTIYYTTSNGNMTTPYAPNAFGMDIVSNEYINGIGIITFTGDVTSIGERAFFSNSNLTSISLPESVKSIGDYAFAKCSNLTRITLHGGVTSIGHGAFWECTSLTNISLLNGVTSIGDAAFQECTNLMSITLPKGVISIGDQAFMGCTNLTSIILPEGVTSIGNRAFDLCTSLTNINIPEGLKILGEGVFCDCTSLTSVTISKGVTSTGDYTFAGCSNLTSITLPDSVAGIGDGAFSECSSLTSIILPNSVTSVGNGAFEHCASLTSIILPISVTSIGDKAFNYCTNLKNVTLSESTSIGIWAFAHCAGLTSITIPEGVPSIGHYAFSFCSNLTSITVFPETPPTGGVQMFGESECPIYVPVGSVESYKTASIWSAYADRIQAIPSIPIPEAVDLGLPSGLKWASFNLGASKPEEYGDYYAWGENNPHYSCLDPLTWKEGYVEGYHWHNYQWSRGSSRWMTKYCTDSSYGYEDFSDGKMVLDPEDDAAHVILGGKWRIPTIGDFEELQNNCSTIWTIKNNVLGLWFTSNLNGESVFFPAAGQRNYTSLIQGGFFGGLWSSSLCESTPDAAWMLGISSDYVYRHELSRYNGISIRPVCD